MKDTNEYCNVRLFCAMKCTWCDETGHKCTKDDFCVYNEMRELAEESRWRDTATELPEVGKEILMSYAHNHQTDIGYYAGNNKWFRNACDQVSDHIEIAFWRPLPVIRTMEEC